MTSTTYEQRKLGRYFYVLNYRKLGRVLIYSMLVNIILFFLISFVYFHERSPNYYSTNGASNPVQLTAISAPNYSSQALLPDDIPADAEPVTNL